jgi:fluoride ion exporter CrcB/FEX
MQIVLLIGLGGFFGTIARYMIGIAFTQYSINLISLLLR